MVPVYQTKFGIPGGNCIQACLASVLEVGLEDVPDFVNGHDDDGLQWYKRYLEWVVQKGYSTVTLNMDAYSAALEGWCMLGVEAPRHRGTGCMHMVVGWCKVGSDGVSCFWIKHDPLGDRSSDEYEIKDVTFIWRNDHATDH